MFAEVANPILSITLFTGRMRLPQRTRASRTDVLGIIPIQGVECEQKDIDRWKKLRWHLCLWGLAAVQARIGPMRSRRGTGAYYIKCARATRVRATPGNFAQNSACQARAPGLYPGSRSGLVPVGAETSWCGLVALASNSWFFGWISGQTS